MAAARRASSVDGLFWFLDQPLAEAMIIVSIWATYLVPYLVGGVAVSHLTGIVVILACAARVWRRTSYESTVAFFLFSLVIVASVFLSLLKDPTIRSLPEAVKSVILFAVVFFAGLSVSPKFLLNALRPSPYLFVVLVILIFMIAGNPFSLDGRLMLKDFISPNVLGYLAVLNMAVILSNTRLRFVDYSLLLVLLIVMLLCLSRGSLLAFVALIWIRIGVLRGLIIFGSIAVSLGIAFANSELIQRMLIIEDALNSGGSGRFTIWGTLLQTWFQNPSAWLFGFGPGSVHAIFFVDTRIDAAHSLFVGTLYYWGLAGIALLFTVLWLAWREVTRATKSVERTLARDVLLITVVNGLVDETFDASQINVISALFFALVVAVIAESRRSIAEQVQRDGIPGAAVPIS